MKKKILSVVARSIIALTAVAFASACSDGQHSGPPAGLNPSGAVPAIKLQISKVGGTEAAGSSVTVQPGDSVLLEWEVVMGGAAAAGGGTTKPKAAPSNSAALAKPTITLDSTALNLHKEGLDAKGSQVVANVTASAEFILTATSGKDTATGKVNVVIGTQNKALEVTFTAEGGETAEIEQNGSAKLCWQISRPDAKYSITNASTSEVIRASTLAGETAATASDANCMSVEPADTTIYIMLVTAPDSANVEKKVTVNVMSPIKIESFTATPSEISGSTEVTLKWKVTPAEAKVSISPGVGDNLSAEDTKKVTVSQTTEFTLTATLGTSGRSKDSKVTVTLDRSKGVQIVLTTNKASVFVRESFDLSWAVTATSGSVPDGIKIKITGGEFGDDGVDKTEKTGTVQVVPTVGGVTSYIAKIVTGTVESSVSKPVDVAVREWSSPVSEGLVKLAVGPSGGTVYGGYAKGRVDVAEAKNNTIVMSMQKLRIAKQSTTEPWADMLLDYVKLFNSFDSVILKNSIFNDFGDYPVNAITIDPSSEGKRIYIGTSGALFVSKDAGSNWGIVEVIRDFSADGNHTSCKGMKQKGIKSEYKDELVGLRQVCDVVVTKTGRVIIAYDEGLAYNDNVDGRMTDRNNAAYGWQGVAREGQGGNVFAGHVVSALATAEDNAIYAAADNGVWKSIDNGATWTDLGSLAKPVYSIEVIGTAIYAGTKDSIYSYNVDRWELLHSFAGGTSGAAQAECDGGVIPCVLSIKKDPVEEGVIYAGIVGGFYVSRDGGKNWVKVEILHGDEATKKFVVNDIETAMVAGTYRSKVGIYVATSNGLYKTIESISLRQATRGSAVNGYGSGSNTINANVMIMIPIR